MAVSVFGKAGALVRLVGIALASQAFLFEGRGYAQWAETSASTVRPGFALRTEPSPDLVTRSGQALSVTPSYNVRDAQAAVKLFDGGIQRDAFNMTMKSTLLANFAMESQMASNGFDSPTDRLFQQGKNSLVRGRLTGEVGGFRYGTEYRSIGQRFKRTAGMPWRGDQEGHEAWVERSAGWINVKGLLSQYADNVELDPRRPRTAYKLSGSALTIGGQHTPLLTLSYLQGTSEKYGGPLGGSLQRNDVQQYTAALYYWAPMWDITISTTSMPAQEHLQPLHRTDGLYHDVSMTWRPTDRLYIMPALSLQTERYSWNGSRSDTPIAMLCTTWTSVIERLDLSYFGMYMRSSTNDHRTNLTALYTQATMRYDVGREKGRRFISFDVGFNRYADAIYPVASSEELVARVLYTVTEL